MIAFAVLRVHLHSSLVSVTSRRDCRIQLDFPFSVFYFRL
jgi:hypothetical protein